VYALRGGFWLRRLRAIGAPMGLATGVYFLRLDAEREHAVNKVLMLH
jgi:hypothetical protein